MARRISGTVMIAGDSWMWCCTSSIGAVLAEEGHEDEAEDVDAGEQDGDHGHRPHDVVAAREGGAEDLVLGPEAGEGDHADHRQGADEHRPERDGDLLAQAAHLAHVLLARHRVDHRARAEEHEALEEAVREQVEDAGHPGARPERQEHEAQRRDRGVGDHLLDVVLGDRDVRRVDGREGADAHDDEHRRVRVDEERVRARHHVHAGVDHGGGVDQRADRRGALHGVRQPDVQRELGALADGAGEEQQADPQRACRSRSSPPSRTRR